MDIFIDTFIFITTISTTKNVIVHF